MKTKKPFLLYHHKQLRYEWAKECKDWMEEQWRNDLFSYESKFNIAGVEG